MNDKSYEILEKLFNSLKNRYQNNLESIKRSVFVFDYIHLLYYKINSE